MPELLLLIFGTSVAVYLALTLLLLIGSYRLSYPKQKKLYTISILVPLKDEAKSVSACVESLLQQEYPEHLLEIWLINDRSNDGTGEIIEAFGKQSLRVRVLHISRTISGLSGKANAIAQAIRNCSGELILITDGDCRLPKTWARTHVSYFAENVGMVGGFTLLDEKYDRTSLFGKVQSLDWAYLLSVGASAIGLGVPLSILGNNFSFRRAAYEQVGGYEKMNFTIVEDFALMRRLVKSTSWQVCYPIDPEMQVYSQPLPGWRQFYQQRKRWAAGGREMPLHNKLLMAAALLVHLAILLAFPVAPVLALAGLALVCTADFILLSRTTGMVRRRDLLACFPLWQCFYFFHTIFFTPVLLFPTTVTWKRVSYSWKFNRKLKRMIDPAE